MMIITRGFGKEAKGEYVSVPVCKPGIVSGEYGTKHMTGYEFEPNIRARAEKKLVPGITNSDEIELLPGIINSKELKPIVSGREVV